jgi:hypothetical protein
LIRRVPSFGDVNVTVAAARLAGARQHHVGEGQLDVVGQAVDEDHVALQQVGPHGAGRNRIPVGHRGAEHTEQQHEQQETLVGAHERFHWTSLLLL